MKEREVIKKMLEALEVANSCVDGYYIPKGKTQLPEVEEAITAANEILAHPEQEPVAKVSKSYVNNIQWFNEVPEFDTLLYTTPPQRTWVGLTKKEVHDLFHPEFEVFHQRIETKLKERNT